MDYDQKRAFFSLFLPPFFVRWPIRPVQTLAVSPQLAHVSRRFPARRLCLAFVVLLRCRFPCGVEFRFRDNRA